MTGTYPSSPAELTSGGGLLLTGIDKPRNPEMTGAYATAPGPTTGQLWPRPV